MPRRPSAGLSVTGGMRHRPDIDGLRAISVLLVIFYHFGLHASGGFVGVDVFFVISGYLITGNIQTQLIESRFQYLDFWSRRCRRLLPALYATLFGTLIFGWLLLLPGHFSDLGSATVAQIFFLSNFYYWKTVFWAFFWQCYSARSLTFLKSPPEGTK